MSKPKAEERQDMNRCNQCHRPLPPGAPADVVAEGRLFCTFLCAIRFARRLTSYPLRNH